jgi:cytochrome b561
MARSSIRLNPEQRYGRGAVLFHWSIFLLVLGVATLGLLHDSWSKATQAFWINIHAVLGLLVWLLLFARFSWRMRHTPPALPAEIGTFSRRASAIVHFALYGLLFVIPIIGIVTFVWHGRVFDFGLLQVNFGVQKNKAIFHPTEEVHGYLAYVLFGLVGIHVLAALWHHFIRHYNVLRRMWPGAADRPGAR